MRRPFCRACPKAMAWDLFSLVAQVPPRPRSRPRKRNAFIRKSRSRPTEEPAGEVVSSSVPGAPENQQPKVETAVPIPSTGGDGTISATDGTGVNVVPPQHVDASTQTDWKWVEQQRTIAKATNSSPPQPSAKASKAKEHNQESQATGKKTKSKEQAHKPQLDGEEADSGKPSGKPTNALKPTPESPRKPLKSILKKQVSFSPMAEYVPPPYDRSPSPNFDSNSSDDSYIDPTFGIISPPPAYTIRPSSTISRAVRTRDSRMDDTADGFEEEQPRGPHVGTAPRYILGPSPPRPTSYQSSRYTSSPTKSSHTHSAYHSSPTMPYYHTPDSDLDSDTGSFIDTAPLDWIFPSSSIHTSPHRVRFANNGSSEYHIPLQSHVPSFEQGIGTKSTPRRNSNESPTSSHSAVEEWDEGIGPAGAGGRYMMRGALDEGSGRQPMRNQTPTMEEEEGVDINWR